MEREREAETARRRSARSQFYQRIFVRRMYRSMLREAKLRLMKAKMDYAKTKCEPKHISSNGPCVCYVITRLDNERVVIQTSRGKRFVYGCANSMVDKDELIAGARIAVDLKRCVILRILSPQEDHVDPRLYEMLRENPEIFFYEELGGISKQILDLRESIELPIENPEIFRRVGIKPHKSVLLHGPPGTGKTLLVKTFASNMAVDFLKVSATALSQRIIKKMFSYARAHQPSIIFIDEIDAIGGKRFSTSSAKNRSVQRVLEEFLHQLDEVDPYEEVKVIMATNRIDFLDPALLRPGRVDRKIEFPLPDQKSRMEILKVHATDIEIHGEIDYETVVKLSEGFNAADIRNVCTEAGLFAIRKQRDYVTNEDFMKAVHKMVETKKMESSAHYY